MMEAASAGGSSGDSSAHVAAACLPACHSLRPLPHTPCLPACPCRRCGGDGLADIVGRRLGSTNPLPWNPQKSWAGSAAMLLGGFTASMALISFFCALGYMDCELLPMASTGAWPLLGLAWVGRGRAGVCWGGVGWGGEEPQRRLPPSLAAPWLQWGSSRWWLMSSSRCPSTRQWTTTCRSPAWRLSWAS